MSGPSVAACGPQGRPTVAGAPPRGLLWEILAHWDRAGPSAHLALQARPCHTHDASRAQSPHAQCPISGADLSRYPGSALQLRTRECSYQSSALGVSRSAQALRCTLCTCRAPAQSPGSLRSEQLVLRVRDRGVDQQAAHAPLGRRQVLQLQPRSSHRVCRGSRRPSVLWLADRQTVGPFSGTQVDSGPFSGTQVDRGWLSPAVRAARSRSL